MLRMFRITSEEKSGPLNASLQSKRPKGNDMLTNRRSDEAAFSLSPLVIQKSLVVVIALVLCYGNVWAGDAIVTNGKFTNIYVYPTSDIESWEQHMASLRPADAAMFSRASIDKFTSDIMSPEWPSYFDPLFQYSSHIPPTSSGIYPPQFFGSAVATTSCTDEVRKRLADDLPLNWDSIRKLANCHTSGNDPSPQVNLIFSPDFKIAKPTDHSFGTGQDMCTTSTTNGWHSAWLNTPNFAVLPTSKACVDTFASFTQLLSHEVIEILSDPALLGDADFPPSDNSELADKCEDTDRTTQWGQYSLSRYWSNFDNNCQPRLDPPPNSASETWILGQGSPLQRFTGDVHTLNLGLPDARVTTNAPLTQAILVIETGSDDLRRGSNANATLNFVGGASTATFNLNGGRNWQNGETHAAQLSRPAGSGSVRQLGGGFWLVLPFPPPRVSDITGVTITTHFGGGTSGDNWNVDKVALLVSFPIGSRTWRTKPPTIVHEWLNASGAPLVRFTGDKHDHSEPVVAQDVGVSALNLIIRTGNDDLRGGSHANDNCDVSVELATGETIFLPNVNQGHTWPGWSSNTVAIPVPPAGLSGRDVKAIRLHTGFGGGIDGDNWNVNQIQLEATLREVEITPVLNLLLRK